MRKLCFPVFLVLATACGPAKENNETQNIPVVTEQSVDGLKVEILAQNTFSVGQNRVFYRVTQNDELVTQATLSQKPLMQMTTHQHRCPVINPESSANSNGLFEGLLVFNMASMTDAYWTLAVEVTLPGETPITVGLGRLEVAESTWKKMLTRPDGRSILLTAGFLDAPQVGKNTLMVTAHESANMGMAFVPQDDLTFTLTPEMPSMGHGSSGNIAPTLSKPGLYQGTVNFSMAGDWTLTLGVKAQDSSLATVTFGMNL